MMTIRADITRVEKACCLSLPRPPAARSRITSARKLRLQSSRTRLGAAVAGVTSSVCMRRWRCTQGARGTRPRRGQGKHSEPGGRFGHCARAGDIAPHDPVLRDSSLYGTGLYSQADLLRFLGNAKPYGPADCELEGQVPAGLDGTLYHIGPGRCERGGTVYKHFLDGDGFANAWHISSGSVRYRGDFVRTPQYEAEEAADRVLFRGAFGTAKPGGPLTNAFDISSKNLANTNIVYWGGQLLALYEAGHPSRLNAATLSYEGEVDFDGLLLPGLSASSGFGPLDEVLGMGGTAFTAHPKMDPLQRRFVGFSWASKDGGIELQTHEWSEEFGCPVPEASTKHFVPGCDSSPHDFGVTERRSVFFENRFRLGDLPGYLLGVKGPAESLVSEPELPQRIHVLPREPGQRSLTIEGQQSVFDVHVAHCHDGPPIGDGGFDVLGDAADLVTAYTSSWDEFPEGSLFGEWGKEQSDWSFELPKNVPPADMSATPRARLVRHVVDVQNSKVLERSLVRGCEDLCMEHPTINCSYTGSPECRYIYMVIGNESGRSTPPCGWARVDLRTGKSQRWYAGSRAYADEPHFVPRQGPRGTWTPGSPQGEEDDGWLLAMLFDADRGRSCLCVFDAAKIDAGPICRAWLPHAVPHSLHGCFVPA